MSRPTLTRLQRGLIYTIGALVLVLAAIGFTGSYAAVRGLAKEQGFGQFALVFPVGIDAGIIVLLALDLLLAWLRIPMPLLRHTAWLLTAATIAFNAATAWPDPLGTGMHAVIPILFVVAVEAARHAVGRIADITADKHMDGVRLARWLLAPFPTFRLWRRMKLWELRSYEQVIKLEQDRIIYQARLQARFGRNWRRKAPIEALMPLRLAKHGVPLADTAPAGLAAAGITTALQLHPAAPAPVQPQPDAQPTAPEGLRPDAADAFDVAADEALALAPPAPPPALEAAPAAEAQPDAPATAVVQTDAQPTAPPAPPNTAPPGARLLPVICRPVLGRKGLHLALAPMYGPSPDVTSDAHLPPVQPQPRLPAQATDEELIAAAVALAAKQPLSERLLQRELRVGQTRSKRICRAARERAAAAAAAAAAEERNRTALATTG
ncbi:DUF2637 domain-containing protein [Streptomyces sp. NPDC102402]|uniref:DUF2637 domain-containing protein n=1 Tax=Streptomyces sp. NPDC102402 TaxID=3366169 RepID=UPI003818665F